MTRGRQAVELLGLVVGSVALRELIGRIVAMLPPTSSGLPFYLLWLIAVVVAARVWGWPRIAPERATWRSGWNLLALGCVLVGVDYLYGFKLTYLVTGRFWLHWPASMWVTLNAVVAAPVIEELIFRGLLWDAVRTRSNTLGALVITSVLFALFHLASIFDLTWQTNAGTPLLAHAQFGAAMGILRWRFGAIGPGLAIHALYNGLWVIMG